MKSAIALTLILVVAAQTADWHKIQSYGSAIGASHANLNIIRGAVVPPGLLPFQVLIAIDGDLTDICGGSLIKADKVLTAAHCCDGAKFFGVFLATINFAIEEPNRKYVTTTSFKIHEKYTNISDYDICVIHLDEEVRGEGIATIRLPSRSQVKTTFDGFRATIAGWGNTKNNDHSNTVLRYTDLIIMKKTFCSQYYNDFDAEKLMCTYNVVYASATCKGDSGGPLIITESDGVKTQVGILSFGPKPGVGGCESHRPDGHVRLTAHLDWIKSGLE
ncbi:brachyurin-like [Cloeon dipterum]|uniref:brachyurin-like n=1 Tax=Cloeon dipterum TaxID=197152 RepID=UPI00321FDAD2